MKAKTHFAFRVDIWDDTGDSIVEHVAGVDDFEVAEATYRVTLRQGARVGSVQNLSHFRFGWLSTPVSVSRFGLAPRWVPASAGWPCGRASDPPWLRRAGIGRDASGGWRAS
jgi:hypothetical protein